MTESSCRHEREVLAAAASGRWDEALTAHIVTCQDCADLALVSGSLHATEAPRELTVDTAVASRIWRAADAEKRREQAARALLPLAVGELGACLFGGLALLFFALRYLGSLGAVPKAVGAHLLADPVLWSMGGVTVALLLGVSVVSLLLAVGFRATRS